MDIGGKKLKLVEASLATLNTQIDTLSGMLTKANVTAKTAER